MNTPIKLVIGFVGVTLLTALVGIVVLASQGLGVPDVLQNIAIGALTGLVGLLVPAGRNESVVVEPKGDVVVSDLQERP
jgi:hypothetical protein